MSESPAIPDPKVVEVVKQLESEGFDSSHLDEAVQDAAADRVSGINNKGLYAQVFYLMRGSDHSWKPDDVLFAAREQKVSDEVDDTFPDDDSDPEPQAAAEDDPLPKFMLSRGGDLKGEIIGTRACKLEGCGGEAYIVRWPGGRRTYPCGKGCKASDLPDTIQIA